MNIKMKCIVKKRVSFNEFLKIKFNMSLIMLEANKMSMKVRTIPIVKLIFCFNFCFIFLKRD